MQWRDLPPVRRVHLCPLGQQQQRHVLETVIRRHLQRGLELFVRCVRVRSVLDQQRHHFHGTTPRRRPPPPPPTTPPRPAPGCRAPQTPRRSPVRPPGPRPRRTGRSQRRAGGPSTACSPHAPPILAPPASCRRTADFISTA